MPPFLILETGRPVVSMQRHGRFPHWIRVAAGLAPAAVESIDIERGAPLPSIDGNAYSGVIVTGSGAMVTDRLDWSEACARWLAGAARAGVPVLGICYGHQLLAHALGGEVGDLPGGREMGTVELQLLPAAAGDPLFAGMPDRILVQATHQQGVLRAPDGATVLAGSARDACHAFRWGKAAWGVQFHPEFSTTHMRGYLRARSEALLREGQDPGALLRDVCAAPLSRRVLRRFVRHARKLAPANAPDIPA